MRNKHIDIRHHCLSDMVEDKDMGIKYIVSEENPTDIMMKKYSEANYVKHTKRITEGEILELALTGRDNFKNNGVWDGLIDCDSTEYYSHALADAPNKEIRNNWILVTRYKNGE